MMTLAIWWIRIRELKSAAAQWIVPSAAPQRGAWAARSCLPLFTHLRICHKSRCSSLSSCLLTWVQVRLFYIWNYIVFLNVSIIARPLSKLQPNWFSEKQNIWWGQYLPKVFNSLKYSSGEPSAGTQKHFMVFLIYWPLCTFSTAF